MALWGDPQVGRYITASGAFSRQEAAGRLQTERENQRLHGVQYWPVFLLEGEAFAGCCGLRPFPSEDRAYELGVHLLPSYWGRGLATEAARAAIDYAFSSLEAQALFAGHHPENHGSKKVLKKIGFQSIGDHFYPPTGLLHPSYRYLPNNN